MDMLGNLMIPMYFPCKAKHLPNTISRFEINSRTPSNNQCNFNTFCCRVFSGNDLFVANENQARRNNQKGKERAPERGRDSPNTCFTNFC